MNKIQNCVYIVRRTPVIPTITKGEDRVTWTEYFVQCGEMRQKSAPFCKAATQYRANLKDLKLRPYASRSVTDDDNGARELIDSFLGNGSVVLLDLRGLPNAAKALVSMVPGEYADSINLFENDGFHSLSQCQAIELAEELKEHDPMPLMPI